MYAVCSQVSDFKNPFESHHSIAAVLVLENNWVTVLTFCRSLFALSK